jgi:hypothetical protein
MLAFVVYLLFFKLLLLLLLLLTANRLDAQLLYVTIVHFLML